MPNQPKYIYGPVSSRRLGRSLGVDIVPYKVCTQDCVYCQLGSTGRTTLRRRRWVPVEDVLAELSATLADGLEADFITFAGSGEPTLNSQLGEILRRARGITDIPLAVLTNGTLFYRPEVRKDCCYADLVIPSLDAAEERTYRTINRPHPDISIEKLVSGLVEFRKQFSGQIWLEVFLLDGLNTDSKQIADIKALVERIGPDKVHLNTAVRPTAVPGIKAVPLKRLHRIAARLGPKCEVIAEFPAGRPPKKRTTNPHYVFSMLERRPCSLAEICTALAIHPDLARRYLASLRRSGLISSYRKNKITFYEAVRNSSNTT